MQTRPLIFAARLPRLDAFAVVGGSAAARVRHEAALVAVGEAELDLAFDRGRLTALRRLRYVDDVGSETLSLGGAVAFAVARNLHSMQ